MKTILVTGATGFVGKHFVKAAMNKYKVICLARETSDVSILPPELDVRYGDFLNKDSLISATKNIDYVVNLGASVQSIDKDENYKINVIGTQNLVDVCKQNNIKKIIHLSSVNVTFGELGMYGKTKLQSESIIKNSGIQYVILRPETIYGHGDKGLSMSYKLLSKNKNIPVIGDTYVRPIYVNDVCTAILNSLTNKAALNNTYYIGGASKLTIKQYMEKIAAITNTGNKRFIRLPALPFKIIVKLSELLGKRWLMTYEQYLSMTQTKDLDINPAEKDLNLRPLDFDTGLKLWLEDVKPYENFVSAR